MAFAVTIITPERALPEVQAEHVTLLAADGQIGIRTGHAPIVMAMKEEGFAYIRPSPSAEFLLFALRGGVAHMLGNKLRILTPQALDMHSFDTAAAKAAIEKEKDDARRAWTRHLVAVAAAYPFQREHV